MYVRFLKNLFFYNTILFIIFFVLFLFFPKFDIFLSNLFFYENQFISEKYTFIKDLRVVLKNLMIALPIFAILLLVVSLINKKQNVKSFFDLKMQYALFGLILGPIIGCGIIANLYFKDTWGRARPVHIEEFGGDKIFTPAFIKSDQCDKNCSWISGEASAAFSFLVGTVLLKNHIFFVINLILGFLVFFCRLSMGGHFFSDNIFAMIFMVYLAILYQKIIYSFFINGSSNEDNSNNN